ncbi:MAG: AAA family ATPase [Anaerolineales bacterium]|nr:AAA family ATPase [Anaerolineales bacterium]
MKIKSIRIQNFRSFQDETIYLNKYSCFVGPNGAGKSSVLAALNVFFKDQSSAFDTANLEDEDYFCMDTANPVRITVTFNELNQSALEELSDYVRQNELIVTAEAVFDTNTGYGSIKHYGQRLGFEEFRIFFDREKAKASANDLGTIYTGLQQQFPDLPNVRSKDDKAEALRAYEAGHPDHCVLIPSEDSFYGINSTGKLSKFVTWVYVPAVKDASDEIEEAKDTALGKLIERTVRNHIKFDDDIKALRVETLSKYQAILDKNQAGLAEISTSLQKRLGDWAHPNVQLGMNWRSDPNKSVSIQQPVAGIKTGEGDFIGSLARMGNGLQRSYLLALLQELANSDAPDAPTLLLGCEEPELYQHPPQARHLADVFIDLAKGNNQIIVTTHSPLFVSGDGFEDIRLTRKVNAVAGSKVRGIEFQKLCDRIRVARGEVPNDRIAGLIAKIHQALQPNIAEMFFARVPILVEGLEDISYITTELHLSNQWTEFRRFGCHIIPVGGKDKLIQPLAIALELGLPVYVVFDADGNTTRPDHRIQHERDNRAIFTLLDLTHDPFPADTIIGMNHAVWNHNLTEVVKSDIGADYQRLTDTVRVNYAQEVGLEKNDLFIAEWLTAAYNEGLRSQNLMTLCNSILQYARENAL